MKTKYDVIIVGTGVSGLFCALHLPETLDILMITKGRLEESNSFLAQGGICVLRDEADFESYVEDTLRAGKYENNRRAVESMIRESRQMINTLIEYGVDFDQKDGELLYTKEAAHSENRILHHKDVTGKEITSKLLKRVQERSNIQLIEYCTLVDLIQDEKSVQGILVNYEEQYHIIKADQVVVATGGIGGIFEHSTNFRHITGDGVAIALKHQIKVDHINYIQIHPTTLYSQKGGRAFLISEAVRGEGAWLLNHREERFVDELLPRDIVTQVIAQEMQKEHEDHVYLSLKHLNGTYIKERFPNIYKACEEEGYDMTKDYIPITPAQHYFMGGISVDLNSQTSLENLFAVGETSCTGVHGANRLASNSLLEGLVFAKHAAEEIIRIRQFRRRIDKRINMESIQMEASLSEVQKQYKVMLLEAIKRKDEKFYAKWCHEECRCG